MESNDSPEIPDRGETSDIPGLPSGGKNNGSREKSKRVDSKVESNDSATLDKFNAQQQATC